MKRHNPFTSFALWALPLVLAAGCSRAANDSAKAAGPPPAVPVAVADVAVKDVPVEVRAIGNVEPIESVQIKSQVNGQIVAVHFKEGQDVKKGELLFELDPAPFEAELAKAQGQMAKDVAQAANDKADAARYVELSKQGVVSRQQYDAAIAKAQSSEASVAADKAAVDAARVQLRFTKLYSPVTGRTGNLLVQRGNLVKANDTPFLVTVNQISPIYVSFNVPEQQLPDIKKVASSGLKVTTYPQGQTTDGHTGKLTFIDNAVDPTTGTIKLKATFANTDRALWPGQFVDVHLTLSTERNAVVVPSQAVQNSQQGQYVYVVKPDMTVDMRPVKVERTFEDGSIIASGLGSGERVVTDGQLRLTKGSKIEIKQAASRPASADVSAQGL